ncbi:MAG TPA: hypothetical protein VMM12_05045 [Longimicrobiales bacterium]|nr:hypothetical protein [Longimicrobiales bacterium]
MAGRGRGLRTRLAEAVARARRRWRGVAPRTRVEVRCERAEHGGWWICPQAVRPGDVAYSFGLGGDLSFERALAEVYGARVFAFDPAPSVEPAAATGRPEALRHFRMSVGGKNERREVPLPGGRAVSARVLRLPSHMRMLAHRRVDLIRLDVPGVEADVIADLVRMDVDVHQLLVGFEASRTTESRDRVEAAVTALRAHGYRVFHVSPDRRVLSFIRTDFAGR